MRNSTLLIFLESFFQTVLFAGKLGEKNPTWKYSSAKNQNPQWWWWVLAFLSIFLWLITSKRFEIESWDQSHFEDILEENMLNFQNEGCWVHRGPQGALKDQKWPELTKTLNFQDFATIHFTQVDNFCYFYTDLTRRELQRMKERERRPLGAQQGGPRGPKRSKNG